MEKNKLKNLLGPEWTTEEIEEVAKSFPNLESDAESLNKAFQEFQLKDTPQLSPNFSQRVIDNLDQPKTTYTSLKRWFTWPKLVSGLTIICLSVGALYWSLLSNKTLSPGTSIITQTDNMTLSPTYRVRFVIHQPTAKQVSVAGDFTQWQQITLRKQANGIFWGELSIPKGTYAYGFFVDHQWIPDPKSDAKITDGFGGLNSVINL